MQCLQVLLLLVQLLLQLLQLLSRKGEATDRIVDRDVRRTSGMRHETGLQQHLLLSLHAGRCHQLRNNQTHSVSKRRKQRADLLELID